MSILLVELNGNRELNHTMWPPYLYVFDDLLVYKKRSWFKVHEITLSYSHIVRMDLHKGIFFATINIMTSADENVTIKHVWKKSAIEAKKIIDHKIYASVAKHQQKEEPRLDSQTQSFEKSLNRLNELVSKKAISQKEFNKKKSDLLKKLR